MITSLEILSFKSFVKQDVNFAPLTLFSGLNNSGKSSIIQALRMMGRASMGKSPLLDGHGKVSDIRSKSSSPTSDIIFRAILNNGKMSNLKISDDSIEKPEIFPVYSYVGADRLGPRATLPLKITSDSYPFIGEKCEYVLDFINQLSFCSIPTALVHPSSEGTILEYVLKGWISEIAPDVDFKFFSDETSDLTRASFDDFRPTNVGFGLSYTLPVLAAALGLASSSPARGWDNPWGQKWQDLKIDTGSMLILENPEAHLHPQGQTAIGRFLAIAASCGLQVVVETHSDHVMDGIRLAIKEGLLEPSSAIFHFLTKGKDGLSRIQTPKIHRDGKLDFWPEGFFDQTMKNRAQLARKS